MSLFSTIHFKDPLLYVFIAFSFLSYVIISEKLLNDYDLSLVIPISQIGMLLASAGSIALGNPFKWSLVLGLFVLSAGSIMISLSAVPWSSTEAIFAGFLKVPKQLWLLIILQALIFTIPSMITYPGTKETVRTEMIMYALRRLHIGPISFHGAFCFNLGQ
jgi:hypothetical protein